MPSVVQFGAGAIGRGFLGPLWCEAGYDVVFVELDRALVEALNQTASYTLRLVDNDFTDERVIGPVRALHVDQVEAIQQALAQCAFAATAVGVENLTAVARHLNASPLTPTSPPAPVGRGGQEEVPYCPPARVPRAARVVGLGGGQGGRLIVCENGDDPAGYLRSLLPETITLYNGIIGRAVPPPTRTEVLAEPYGDLRVAPALPWTIPGVFTASHYEAEVARKLYLHNGGHFYLACLGLQQGYSLLWQAAEDTVLVAQLEAFWAEVRAGLSAAFGLTGLKPYTDTLLQRFRNRPLSDPCARIARNPERKLARGERLLGPRALCEKHRLPTIGIDQAIAVALQTALRNEGV